jgi:hypothetical protein
MLKIWVLGVEQLELDLIIKTLENVSSFVLSMMTLSMAYLNS